MKIVVGDLWTELNQANFLLVTTNSTVDKNGKLVMGRGAAKEMADKFSSLPYEFGRVLREKGKVNGSYGILFVPPDSQYPLTYLGIFQVKWHWHDSASRILIRQSVDQLSEIARAFTFSRFAMNFPGIGNGRLLESEVLPYLEKLPDNVFVYKKS